MVAPLIRKFAIRNLAEDPSAQYPLDDPDLGFQMVEYVCQAFGSLEGVEGFATDHEGVHKPNPCFFLISMKPIESGLQDCGVGFLGVELRGILDQKSRSFLDERSSTNFAEGDCRPNASWSLRYSGSECQDARI